MIGKGQYNIPQCQNRMTTEERKEARRGGIYTYKRSHVIRRQQSWKNQHTPTRTGVEKRKGKKRKENKIKIKVKLREEETKIVSMAKKERRQ